jgi:hypothetical protein
MDFGAILSRAWQIIKKHKALWVFGILAGFGNSVVSGGSNSGIRYSFSPEDAPNQFDPWLRQFERIPDWQLVTFMVIIGLIILGLVILAIILGTVGRIGLIQGTFLAEKGDERIPFAQLFSASMGYFWRVLAVNLVGGILLGIGFLILAIPVGIITCGIGLLCMVPLIWFAQLVIEQTNIAIVVENTGIGDGLRRAWEVVTKNLGAMIVMALILYLGVGLIAGAVIGLPIALIVGPGVAGMIFGAAQEIPQVIGGSVLVAGLCLVAYLPVLILLNGILRAYISSAWTLTYMKLASRPVVVEPIPPAL